MDKKKGTTTWHDDTTERQFLHPPLPLFFWQIWRKVSFFEENFIKRTVNDLNLHCGSARTKIGYWLEKKIEKIFFFCWFFRSFSNMWHSQWINLSFYFVKSENYFLYFPHKHSTRRSIVNAGVSAADSTPPLKHSRSSFCITEKSYILRPVANVFAQQWSLVFSTKWWRSFWTIQRSYSFDKSLIHWQNVRASEKTHVLGEEGLGVSVFITDLGRP